MFDSIRSFINILKSKHLLISNTFSAKTNNLILMLSILSSNTIHNSQ